MIWSSREQTLLNVLTRQCELPGGQVSQGAVRPVFVAVQLPSFGFRAGSGIAARSSILPAVGR